MAYFSYTPEAEDQGKPANLELISTDEADFLDMKQRLLQWVRNDLHEYVVSNDPTAVGFDEVVDEITADVDEIENLDPRNVPLKTAVPFFVAENADPLVIDSRYGLSLVPNDDETKFIIGPDHFEPNEEAANLIDRDPEVLRQILLGRYTCTTYQIEPNIPTGDIASYTCHVSLGYPDPTDPDGYIPMVTVLNETHPAHAFANTA